MPMPHRFVPRLLLCVALLAGAPGMHAANPPQDPLEASIAGEFALQAGQLPEAARQYLQAARAASDPVLAERATRIALLANEDALARESYGLWHPQEGVVNGHFQPSESERIQKVGMVEIRDAIQYFDSPKYLRLWAGEARKQKADTRVFLYETWHRLDDKDGWLNRLDGDLGKYWEGKAKRQTGDAIRALTALRPTVAHLMPNQVDRLDEMDVSPDELLPDDAIRVLPGERFPVDGFIEEGDTQADE